MTTAPTATPIASRHCTPAAMALPGVARLHYLNCADHVAAVVLKAGKQPQGDPRYLAFLAKADAA